MRNINADDLINFAKSLEGQELYTAAQRKRFTVRVIRNTLVYTPLSGIPRVHSYKRLVRFCNEFSTTKSLKPADYAHISWNASYLLVIIAQYIERQPAR